MAGAELEVEAWAPVPQGRGYESKEASSLPSWNSPSEMWQQQGCWLPQRQRVWQSTKHRGERPFVPGAKATASPKCQPGAAGSGEKPPRPDLKRLAGSGGRGRTNKVRAMGRVLQRPAPCCLNPAPLVVLLPTVPFNDR